MDQNSPELPLPNSDASFAATLASLAALEKSYTQNYSGSERINRPNRQPSKHSKRLLFALGILPIAMVIATYVNHPTKADYTPSSPIAASAVVAEMPTNQVAPIEIQTQTISQENLADRIFANLNQEEKQRFQEAIIKQSQIYQSDSTRINNTLNWTSMLDLIVKDQRLKLTPEEGDLWKQRMLKLIFVESEGNPKASSGIAYGLTQLRTDTAKDAAQIIGVSKFDIYNPWDNMILGLVHQLNLNKRYGPDLGAWAHHLGSGNMDLAIKAYLIQVQKIPVKNFDIEKIPEYVKLYGIEPFVLLKEPAVVGALKSAGAFGDSTDEYFIRLTGAGQALKDFQQKNLTPARTRD